MKKESTSCSTVLPVSADLLYHAWLDSKLHSGFTGSLATIQAKVGGKYSAWDGYITGVTLELDPPRRILQSWRTTDFAEEMPDSRLEILFAEVEGGTLITLNHTNLPDGEGENYRQGWEDYYFTPMQEYFSR